MKAYELEELLKKGYFVRSTFTGMWLYDNRCNQVETKTGLPKRVRQRTLTALIKDGVIQEDHEEFAINFRYRSFIDEPNINWQQRAEKAESERDELKAIIMAQDPPATVIGKRICVTLPLEWISEELKKGKR